MSANWERADIDPEPISLPTREWIVCEEKESGCWCVDQTGMAFVGGHVRQIWIPGHIKNWRVNVAQDGSYRVSLSGVRERTLVANWAEAGEPGESEPTSVLNMFLLKTVTMSRGLVRLDLDDVKLPPVVVHVEVPPIADARLDVVNGSPQPKHFGGRSNRSVMDSITRSAISRLPLSRKM